MKIALVIPVRMNSSRFPGKPLHPICEVPMIERIYENMQPLASKLDILIATCDAEIADYMESKGATVVMTSSLHQRASDRCAEAIDHIEQSTGYTYNIVTMLQGDEPLITADMVWSGLLPLIKEPSLQVTNLLGPINDLNTFHNPNIIKVVHDNNMNALYFSRLPIPSFVSTTNLKQTGKQVCSISFQRSVLDKYLKLEPTALEEAESIDMLRLLQHGIPVHLVRTNIDTHPVDTIEDIRIVENYLLSRESNAA